MCDFLDPDPADVYSGSDARTNSVLNSDTQPPARMASQISSVPDFRSWVIAKVREYLKDFAEKNKLLLKVESLDSDIDGAIDHVVEYYNMASPPLVPIGLRDYPSLRLMRMGCALELLQSEIFLRMRNDLTYQDGSLAVNEDDRWRSYLQLVDRLEQIYKKEVRDYKAQLNISASMMGVSSPYAHLHHIYLMQIGGR